MVEIFTNPLIANGLNVLFAGIGVGFGAAGVGICIYLWCIGLNNV